MDVIKVLTSDGKEVTIDSSIKNLLESTGIITFKEYLVPSGLVAPQVTTAIYTTKLNEAELKSVITANTGTGNVQPPGTSGEVWSIRQYVSPGFAAKATFPGVIDDLKVEHKFQNFVIYGGINRNQYNFNIPRDAKEGQTVRITGRLDSGRVFSAEYVVKSGDWSSDWYGGSAPKQTASSDDADIWNTQMRISRGNTSTIMFPSDVVSLNKAGTLAKSAKVTLSQDKKQIVVEIPQNADFSGTLRVYGELANGKEFTALYWLKDGGFAPIWVPPFKPIYGDEPEPEPEPEPGEPPIVIPKVELSESTFSVDVLVDGKKVAVLEVSLALKS